MNEPSPIDRVRRLLGASHPVLLFDFSTATSADAAAAIGCGIAEIAKSLIFQARGGRLILVVASGVNRVDEKKVATLIGEKIGRADPDVVLERTGYPVGGVAPIGHLESPLVLLDQDLQAYPRIWAAAGAPNAVFALTPADLAALTGAPFVDVARRTGPA